MLKIGLTGGIGSGKSTVSKIFEALGIPVLDADATAKKIMETDVFIKQQLIKTFGEEVYVNDKLQRSYLANIVFNDSYALEKLNAIVHPVTIEYSKKWAASQKAPYTIKEAALMFESASAEGLDFVIGVYAPNHLRINRVMKRDGISRDLVIQRMNHQIDDAIKMKLCDEVVVNDEQQMLLPQVIALHQKLIKLSKES
ncbi:MAG: dephospho-CoA kinase [Chitinophagaceae bacterium]